MSLNEQHLAKVKARGFTDDHIKRLCTQNGHPPVLQSLTAEEIQRDWLDRFPKMKGNEGGALLLRFNAATVSLKPDTPRWDPEKHRYDKYYYAKRPDNQPKGFNTQPWIPSKAPRIATEGLFDALVATALMDTPCAAATAPSHIRYSNFPESVDTYVSDADVPYHHFTGLLPVVIGQCREKNLKLAHLPRNPNANYAYVDERIPEDCKWGMEEWCKEWKAQGLNPKDELKKITDAALEPVPYLRSIFLDYGKTGIEYPLNNAQLTTGARAIADATERPDQRLMLRDLLHRITKAPRKWIDEQIKRRDDARFQEEAERQQQLIAQGLEEPPASPELIPADPYELADGRPIDVHLSNLLLNGDALYGSSQSSLYSYSFTSGFWVRIPQPDALRMVQSEVEKVFTLDPYGRQAYPYGSSQQVSSCLTALVIKANEPKLANPEPCIVFTDQTYNCRTEQTEPHSPENGATYGINAPLSISTECPQVFNDAITTCYGDEALPVIRAWIRAVIDPTIPYGKFLLVIGNTGTGKGLLLEFLSSLLPASCRSALLEPNLLESPDKVYQYVLGKRYISFDDLPARLKQPMQTFYKLVEDADTSIRKLNASDSGTINAHCRFSAGATKLPTLADGNDGIVRRALVLQTKPRLAAPDRNLKAAIVGDTTEHTQLRSEVIGWALSMPRQDVIDTLYGDACSDLLNANLDELEANADAVAHFIDECLEPSLVEVTPVNWDWMFQCFRAYCDSKGFVGKGSQFHLQGAIRAKLPHLHRKKGKESMAVAVANGRDRKSRRNTPACDWGFKLREGLFQRRVDAGTRMVSGCLGDLGLETLRQHQPDCPLDAVEDSGSSSGTTQRPPEVSQSKNLDAAMVDAVSQGSSLIDREEKKEVSIHHKNTHAHTHVTHIKGQSTHIPETQRHTPELPDWADLPF